MLITEKLNNPTLGRLHKGIPSSITLRSWPQTIESSKTRKKMQLLQRYHRTSWAWKNIPMYQKNNNSYEWPPIQRSVASDGWYWGLTYLLFLSDDEAWDLLDFLRPDCLLNRGLFMSSLDLDLYRNLSFISCLILVTQFCLQSRLPAYNINKFTPSIMFLHTSSHFHWIFYRTVIYNSFSL